MPYKFNLDSFEKSGLDVLFYGQEHFDTMAILDDKRGNFIGNDWRLDEKSKDPVKQTTDA